MFFGGWMSTPARSGSTMSMGSRIGKRGDYGETALGVNFMPARSVNFRPEVRWDVAGSPVFGPTTASHLQSHQWTYAFEMLVKF